MITLIAKPLNKHDFAPFGEVIEITDPPSFHINNGACARYHDLARPHVSGSDGAVGISMGRSDHFSLPFKMDMMERHPLGSQAFIPLNDVSYLVVVAPDKDNRPIEPVAFIAKGHQGVQYKANTWHAVLTPLEKTGDFLIVDRIGTEKNLEEFFFEQAYTVVSE